MFFVFDSIPNQYKTQETCDRVVSKDPFLIAYCTDKYETKKMYDGCLAALKFVRYRIVTSEMIKKLFTTLYGDENILYFNKDSNNVDLMKWVFLVEILKMLILVGLIIRKMILVLLFLSDFGLAC